jgi:general stress protein 26
MGPLELADFLRRHKYAVEASVSATGGPQAAVVGIVATPRLELFFDTWDTTRKCANLRRDPRVAFVIGWDDAQTVQFEGTCDQPQGDELARLQELYFARFPDGRGRATHPEIAYFRARPTWVRYSDFRCEPAHVVELSGEDLLGDRSGG